MVNVIHLYIAVIVYTLSGVVDPEVVSSLVNAVLALFMGVGV